MAAVVYFGQDNRLGQILEPFFKHRREDSGEANSYTQITDDKKFDEALVGVNFDLFFIEQNFLPKTALDWLTTFKKKFPRIGAPVVLVGDDTDPVKIMKHIEGGYADYIVNPPDKPLLIEKFVLYSTGKRNRDLRQVYSLQLSQPSDLAKPGVIEELSEFDCKVRGGQKLPIGDLLLLYSKVFSENMVANGSVIGRCYESVEHQSFKGQFLSSFYFVGVTTDILTNIRTTLRKTYVASKSKG